MFCKDPHKDMYFILLLFWAVYQIIFPALWKSTFYVKVTSLRNAFAFVRRMIQPNITFESISQKLTWRPLSAQTRTVNMRSLSRLSRLLMRNTSSKYVLISININTHYLNYLRTQPITNLWNITWKYTTHITTNVYETWRKIIIHVNSPNIKAILEKLRIQSGHLEQRKIKVWRVFLGENEHPCGAQNIANRFDEWISVIYHFPNTNTFLTYGYDICI